MTIPLTGTGGLFKRIGRTVFVLNSLNSWRGTADLSGASCVSLGTGIDNITGQYASSDQFLVDGLYSQRDSCRASVSGLPNTLAQLCANTITQMADDDTVVSSRTLQACLPILISQMKGASQTVNANTVSVGTATGGSNIGTAVIAAGIRGPAGVNHEYIFAETLTATCIADSQSGGRTAGNEIWSIAGELPAFSLNWDWPAGSGANFTVQAQTASTGLLSNGDFETWSTANVPDSWTIAVGTAGTSVLESTSPVFKGSGALRIVGDGAELTSLRQQISTPKPSTVYVVNVWQRVSAVPSAGVLSLDLYDGTSVINDDAGNANQVTFNLTGSTTSFAALHGFFVTPSVLPTNVYLRVRLTTALDSGKSLYLDELCLTTPTQAYTGGPYVAIFSGATASIKNDSFTVTTSNDWGGKFQKAFEAMFGMRNLGFQLPSDSGGTETIPDTLVS